MTELLLYAAPLGSLAGAIGAFFLLKREGFRFAMCWLAASRNYRVQASKDDLIFEPAQRQHQRGGTREKGRS